MSEESKFSDVDGDPGPWSTVSQVVKVSEVSKKSEVQEQQRPVPPPPVESPPGIKMSTIDESEASDVTVLPVALGVQVSDPWQGVPRAWLQPALPRTLPASTTTTKVSEVSEKSEVQEHQTPMIDESDMSDETVLSAPVGLGAQVQEAESEASHAQSEDTPFERINSRLGLTEQQIMYLCDRVDYLISHLD